MRRSPLGAVLPVALLALPLATVGAERVVTATTGKPRVDLRGGTPPRLFARSAYERQAEQEQLAIAAERDPWADRLDVQYGFIGYDRGRRVTFAVRTNERGKPEILVDSNRNGDLRDERVVTAKKDGPRYLADVRLTNPSVLAAAGFFESNDRGVPRIIIMYSTFRKGTARIGRRRVKFAVQGQLGRYGEDWQEIYFDTNGDGTIDDDPFSDERYVKQDEYVNLGGRSWTFEVSEDGSRLTLEALDEKRPDRIRLAPGNPAPDFPFVDLDGERGRLSDYRGRTVVLYFWGTWCGPCRGETPHLREAYERFHDKGLDILAVAKNDTVEAVREYVTTNGIPWRQAIEEDAGPIVSLYRANAIPNSLIIDPEGVIVERSIRGAQLVARLDSLMPGFGTRPGPRRP